MSTIFTFKEMYLGSQFGFITIDAINDKDLSSFKAHSNYVYCLNKGEGTTYVLQLCGGSKVSPEGEIDTNITESPLGIAIFDSYPNSPTIRLTDAEKMWLFSGKSKNHFISNGANSDGKNSIELGIKTLFDTNISTIKSQNLIAYEQEIMGRSCYIFDDHLQLHSFKCVDIKRERYTRREVKKPLINFVIGTKANNNVCEKYKFFFANESQYKVITVCVTFDGEIYVENGKLTDSMIFFTQNAAVFYLNEIKTQYIARLDICKQYVEAGIISEPMEKILKLLNEISIEEE